jgi:hypothetical protein
MSKRKGEDQARPAARDASDRADRDSREQIRAGGQDVSSDRVQRHPETTDERLGLLPAELRTGARDTISDVIGPDRDDLELSERGGLDFAWDQQGSDLQSGSADFRGMEQDRGRQEQAQIIAEETELTTIPHALAEEPGATPDIEPSWTDQTMFTDPVAAVGAPDDNADPVSDNDETYIPPTDPVVTAAGPGNAHVLGGFSATGPEEVHPARSADGEIGDEAIADAVRDALRQDAATTDLEIHVAVSGGVVRLRGTVADLEDADNAEAVAARVEGVVEVQEQLNVTS